MTKSEIQHVWFGIGIVVMALSALWAFRRPQSPARFVWPSVALVIGLVLLFPSETGEGHYEPRGWFQTLRDLWPVHLDVWVAALGNVHVVQHKVAGVLSMTIGGVELTRAAGALKAPVWGRLLPWFSVAIGLVLAFHGGSEHHLRTTVEQLHHWIMGGLFALGGLLLGLQQAGRLRSSLWREAWAVCFFLAGLNLILFYRLPEATGLHLH